MNFPSLHREGQGWVPADTQKSKTKNQRMVGAVGLEPTTR
jgi:hypothetical protein